MDDLEQYAPGFENLSPDEKAALYRFSFLWTIFEAQVLDTHASGKKIKAKVNQWHLANKLTQFFWENQLDYFIDRYVDDGVLNENFYSLQLRDNDDPQLIQDVLLGDKVDTEDTLVAVLIIVLRFRNNYFHGLKWAYEMRDQQINFKMSIDLMRSCIDRFGIHSRVEE